MADEKKDAKTAAADPAAKPKKKKRLLPIIIVGALMSVEAVVLYFAINMFAGKPDAAEAALAAATEEGHGEPGSHGKVGAHGEPGHGPGSSLKQVELMIPEVDVYNNTTGRPFVYRIQICVVGKKYDEQKLRELIEARQNTLQDRIQTIVRSAAPQHLTEPGLEILKKQFRHEIESVLGVESGIEEILVPKLLQIRG